MLMCFTKQTSVINSIYSGQQLYSFYSLNLQMFIIRLSICLRQAFQPSLMFVHKARSQP